MAIPTTWYVRTGGSDLNSGGSDADAAVFSNASFVVVGTGVTVAAGGLSAIGSDALGVNLQVGGVSEIRGYTVNTDTTLTLDAAPSAGDGTYAGKIGGARASIAKVVSVDAGKNVKFATSNKVYLQANATFTENAIEWKHSSGAENSQIFMQGATIDGTGGAAGSDGLFAVLGTCVLVGPGTITNCVDAGLVKTGGGYLAAESMTISSCGGTGCATVGRVIDFRINACATGITPSAMVRFSEILNCTGTGVVLPALSNGFHLDRILIADSGSHGMSAASAGAFEAYLVNVTSEGNAGDGLRLSVVNAGSYLRLWNCALTNNGAYGVNSSAGAQTNASLFDLRANNFHGNATAARNNFPVGATDTATAPGYVNAAGDDYTLDTGSAMIATGYSPFTSPMKVNQGATIAKVAASTGAGGGFGVFPGAWSR